jgi:NADP-dependent 3-hydroxy acid dehydrogenase YdfG
MKKIIFITGASAGIGKSMATYLADKGVTIYAAARRVEKMQDLAALGIHVLSLDVTDENSMVAAVNHIIEKEGRIDVLINNAGFGSYGALEDVPIADARYQLEVNVFGAARLIQLVLPHMREQRAGRIINISSIGGKVSLPLGAWYHASKFALEAISDALRNEVRQFGIDVVVIEPGGIKSEWSDIAVGHSLKNSSKGTYKNMAEKFAGLHHDVKDKVSDPLVIAKLVWKAITAPTPKTRYAAGYMAGPLLTLKKVLSDRMLDRILTSRLQ